MLVLLRLAIVQFCSSSAMSLVKRKSFATAAIEPAQLGALVAKWLSPFEAATFAEVLIHNRLSCAILWLHTSKPRHSYIYIHTYIHLHTYTDTYIHHPPNPSQVFTLSEEEGYEKVTVADIDRYAKLFEMIIPLQQKPMACGKIKKAFERLHSDYSVYKYEAPLWRAAAKTDAERLSELWRKLWRLTKRSPKGASKSVKVTMLKALIVEKLGGEAMLQALWGYKYIYIYVFRW